jgi:GNAT superfamily N-acetyltransferase
MRIGQFQQADKSILASLYSNCFAEEPWHEYFLPLEVEKIFAEINDWPETIFLVAYENEVPIGAVIGFDLNRKEDVQALIINHEFDVEGIFYLAELFVRFDKRHQGIGRKLIKALIKKATSEGYKHTALRTSLWPRLIDLYSKIGFKIIAEQQVTTCKLVGEERINQSDTRIIMIN